MNEKIAELEEQLEAMPVKKLYFIYTGIVFLLVFLSWNLYGESLYNEIESKEANIQKLDKELKDSSIRSFGIAINKAKKESLSLKEELYDLSSKQKFISSKLSAIDFFSQSGIANILDSVLKDSIKYNVDLETIKYIESDKIYIPGIYERVYITVDGAASYKNISHLLDRIDNIKSLLKVNQIEIHVDENQSTNFNIGISHFGVKI
jgi:Tfp pilus assembly protein PilO